MLRPLLAAVLALAVVLAGACDDPSGPPPPDLVFTTPAVELSVDMRRQLRIVDGTDTLPNNDLIEWQAADSAVVIVGNGYVTGRSVGTTVVTAHYDGREATADINVTPLRFRSVTVGARGTCGVTTLATVYCWGDGAGPMPRWITGLARHPVAAVSAGYQERCAIRDGGGLHCWDPGSKAAAAFDTEAASVSVGANHTCIIADDGHAGCRGNNLYGKLGGGVSGGVHDTLVAVVGGITFQQISAGWFHTCGVDVDGMAYCWGANEKGEGGWGDEPAGSNEPRAVSGGIRFRQVSAGFYFTCGVTMDDAAYCWGNGYRTGTGDSADVSVPHPVAGDRAWSDIDAGQAHACALTNEGHAYCWGSNNAGELGHGELHGVELAPVRATTSETFVDITAGWRDSSGSDGGDTSCALTPDGRAFCWGANHYGQIGDGTETRRLTPTPVASPGPPTP